MMKTAPFPTCLNIALIAVLAAIVGVSAPPTVKLAHAKTDENRTIPETISTGWAHSCGVKSDGTLACWGNNREGQSTPPGGTFSQVSAGSWHTCGLKSDGELACWGWNSYGQSNAPLGTFTQVSLGSTHTCGVKSDGTLTCWGNNMWGQSTPPTGTHAEKHASISGPASIVRVSILL